MASGFGVEIYLGYKDDKNRLEWLLGSQADIQLRWLTELSRLTAPLTLDKLWKLWVLKDTNWYLVYLLQCAMDSILHRPSFHDKAWNTRIPGSVHFEEDISIFCYIQYSSGRVHILRNITEGGISSYALHNQYQPTFVLSLGLLSLRFGETCCCQ